MLLAREFVAYLSRQLVKKLTAGVMETTMPDAVAQKTADVINEELAIEDRLNDEVRELLSQYSEYMRREGVSYQDMFRKAKNTLISQRKVIRASGRDTGDNMKLSRDKLTQISHKLVDMYRKSHELRLRNKDTNAVRLEILRFMTELLVADRSKNPSRYSVVLVSEGAMFEGAEMAFEHETTDAFGHKKLGGMGDLVSEKLKELSPKFNHGKTVDVINQRLGYLVRCGDPDAIDSIVPMAYGNLALDLILNKANGRLVVLKTGRYDNVPIDAIAASKKVVNVKEHYNTDRLRPHYKSFENKPLFIMTSELG